LIEVVLACLIMTVALLAAGFLAARMTTGTTQSKNMSTAAVLVSEKLEDLNRWDADDPQVCVPTGSTTVGSLTSDVSQTTSCPTGASATINYYDDVYPNLANGANSCTGTTEGCFAETVSSVSASGTVYTTTVHSPNGIVQTTSSTSPPGGATFHRRWVIEGNSPTSGVRRVTVQIVDSSVNPPVSFQLSIVRP
jgi:Tfp pilus assembly protein PilV